MRIAIIDKSNKRVGTIDTLHDGAPQIWSDTYKSYLEGSVYTYEFTASVTDEIANALVVGNRIAFRYEGKDYYFNIIKVSTNEHTITVTCYSTLLELTNEYATKFSGDNLTLEQYIYNVLCFDMSQLEIGINEVSLFKRTVVNDYQDITILRVLYSLCSAFDAEMELNPVLKEDYTLSKYVINFYRKNSSSTNGIGQFRTDIKLIYNKQISKITKTQDISNLYTAILPTGKDDIVLVGYDKYEYDQDGKLEFYSPLFDGCIYAPQSRELFPSSPIAGEWILRRYSSSADNQSELYNEARDLLKEYSIPKTSYEIDGNFENLNIGDTVTIIDEDFHPKLFMRARVVEIEHSFTDKTRDKIKFDNYTEFTRG